MKVITNSPPAPIVPPPTFDLVGLTVDQMTLLRHTLGATTTVTDEKAGVPTHTGYDLYKEINRAMKGVGL